MRQIASTHTEGGAVVYAAAAHELPNYGAEAILTHPAATRRPSLLPAHGFLSGSGTDKIYES